MTPREKAALRVRFGENLSKARKAANVSQAQLARAIGITQASVSNYESAKRDVPLWIAVDMAGALGLPPLGLLPGREGEQLDG